MDVSELQTDRQPVRREPRFSTRSLIVDAPVTGRVLNVSERGIAIESMERIKVGHEYLFRVRSVHKYLNVPGRVEWCRMTGTRTDSWGQQAAVFRAGVALADSISTRAWRSALTRLTAPQAPAA